MNPAGQLGLAARQIVARGTHVAGLAASSAWAALSRSIRTVARPAGVRGVALEAGVLAMHLVMYPWGALVGQRRPGSPYDCYRTDDLSPTERGRVIADVHAAGTPILLVHGFADNRSVFAVLGRSLRKRGFGMVYGLNHSVLTALTGDVHGAARELGREVERICAATGSEQVHVVGHSLGGLVARYYVQRLGGHARVHTLVTLGTPHQGTMAELAAPSPGCRTHFVSVWSELDVFILPQHNARLDHPDLLVTNHLLNDVGHLSLPVDPRAVHLVASALAQLNGSPSADLTTDVAAANPIGPSPTSAP